MPQWYFLSGFYFLLAFPQNSVFQSKILVSVQEQYLLKKQALNCNLVAVWERRSLRSCNCNLKPLPAIFTIVNTGIKQIPGPYVQQSHYKKPEFLVKCTRISICQDWNVSGVSEGVAGFSLKQSFSSPLQCESVEERRETHSLNVNTLKK